MAGRRADWRHAAGCVLCPLRQDHQHAGRPGAGDCGHRDRREDRQAGGVRRLSPPAATGQLSRPGIAGFQFGTTWESNMARTDPYKNYRFLVEIDGIIQAGFTECTGFVSAIEVIEYREGGDPATVRKLPGKASHHDVTLK